MVMCLTILFMNFIVHIILEIILNYLINISVKIVNILKGT
nr:MAG TPA: hypothetical protein [Caudoviricetes sp.]